MEDAFCSGSPKSLVVKYRVPLILLTIGLGVVIWTTTATPSFFSGSSLSDYQIASFFDTSASYEFENLTSSETGGEDRKGSAEFESDAEFQQSAPLTGLSPGPSPSPSPSPSPAPSPASTVEEIQPKSDNNTFTEFVEDENLAGEAKLADEQAAQNDTQQHGEDSEVVVPLEVVEDEGEEKFIIPQLSYQVGTGNQLMEYKSAAVIARTLNRTLCLIPFFIGPTRHFGHLGDKNSGLYIEDRYDMDVLSRFVKTTSIDECMQKCQKRLDVHWLLRSSRPPKWSQWFNDTPRTSVSFSKNMKVWSSTADIEKTLGPRNLNNGPENKCVGLGGLFPGLRWRGVFFATSAYLQHSKVIMKAADLLQTRAFGEDPYLSVHWRFEESNCRGHKKGLCFSRCHDGKVIANSRPSLWWGNMTIEEEKFGTKDGFNGVFVAMSDLSGAIYDRAVKHGLRSIYLATDGWIPNRGPESRDVVKWVVEDLRSKGLRVVGLWQLKGVPSFADGSSVDSDTLTGLLGLEKDERVSDHMVALLEQEMCGRSAVFLGSGQSTWSLAVADTRRGRRRKAELEEQLKIRESKDRAAVEQQIIDEILSNQFTAGPTCRGSHNPVAQTEEDEAPDGWLDYAACEERLDQGLGQCTRIDS